jgi:hypothetical protein
MRKITPERKAYLKRWNRNNRERQKGNVYRWNEANHEKRLENVRLSKAKFPEKESARNYANRHRQRTFFCQACGSERNLQFHHTNYERNEGITLCAVCHKALHLGGDVKL